MRYPVSLFDLAMYPLEVLALRRRRRRVLRHANGRVLEVGAGTGVNLSYYDAAAVDELHLSDLSITTILRERTNGLSSAVRYHAADAADLPFPDRSFDSVVFTLVFCSVSNPDRGLAEVYRVLRPGGRVIFVEHVRPHGRLGRLADRLNPLWHRFTGECNINRSTLSSLRTAGFRMLESRTGGRGFLLDGVAERPA